MGVRSSSIGCMSSHLDHGGSKEKNMFRSWIAIFMCAVSSSAWSSAPVDVAAYVKRDDFNSIKLSPNGDYYAASVPMEDKSVLVIIRRVDNKATATFNLGK